MDDIYPFGMRYKSPPGDIALISAIKGPFTTGQFIVWFILLIQFLYFLHPLKTFALTQICYLQCFEYQIIKMLRTNILSIALIAIFVVVSSTFPCPATDYRGSIYSAQVTVALDGGVIPIQDGQDTQCYNYSLPYAFNIVPDVSISVFNFQAEASKNLYFFIKPIHSESLSFLPFVVRTQWPYTQWNQISFSFIAEDRNDLQSGYYQIDSGPLSGCESGKLIDVLLPFRNVFARGIQIKHSLFLHGFQIATVKIDGNIRSPFEFQIVSSATNISGIAASLSVTTTTQVNSVYISYMAFQVSTLAIVGGGYVYDATQLAATGPLFYAPENNIPRNFARLYGLTGFLLNYHNNRIIFSTRWDGFTFSFNFGSDQSLLKYFSFSFIFFTGSQCQDCAGYQIFHNNSCLATCPIGTARTPDNTCINCGTGREWNGTACVTSCYQGQYLSNITGLCECPPTLNWNGESCIPCLSGKVFMTNTKTCQCAQPLVWNGFACARIDPCLGGKVWDVYTYSCQCPQATYWNGVQCQSLPTCSGGQVISSTYQCVCLDGYVWSNNQCIYSPCLGGQVWTGSKCICPAGLNFNGSMCLECINGQKWNSRILKCQCQSGYDWNGQYCTKSFKCSNGRVWNAQYQQCICPDGSYWSGYTCLPVQKCFGGQYFDSTISKCICLSGFQWDGKFCVQCNNGRVWNVTTLTCTCPPGTVPILNGCRLQQQCSGGKIWSQNSWTCECPIRTVWNGAFCIANPCPYGQFWNQTIRSCQCPGNKTFINQSCVPPQIACSNGRVWSTDLYACACPQGTFPTVDSCQPMPICTLGKVYNPLNNQCQCPFGLVDRDSLCTNPNCPIGQYFNGFDCQVINCPPPSYFLKDRCIYGANNGQNQCQFGYYWNGVSCSFYPNNCPAGTQWTGSTCQGSGQCGTGYYMGPTSSCVPFPQQCNPPSQWEGTKCSVSGNLCPKGTFVQGPNCMPIEPCKNGFVWDPAYIRCICPPGTINNGNRCVECANDQRWIPGVGCACPDGSFDTGAACEMVTPNKCLVIINAVWSDNRCMCKAGFTKVGFQCICYGTQIGDFCDKCSYKPNSKLVQRSNTCECKEGFTQIRGICIPRGQHIGNEDPSKCAVGTYFDNNHKSCLACPEGCLSCIDCYKCRICRPQFVYDPITQKCFEYCGDGKRYTLECDDGNNIDGDGCARDCKIQSGFTCVGGCPDGRDNCFFYRPDRVQISIMGQIRKTSSVNINLRLNYFPQSLIQAQECANKCNQILIGSIVSGDAGAVSITSQFISGSKYMFAMTVQFGRSYMAQFKLKISINPNVIKYFGGINVQPAELTIQPSYLMAISEQANKLV